MLFIKGKKVFSYRQKREGYIIFSGCFYLRVINVLDQKSFNLIIEVEKKIR